MREAPPGRRRAVVAAAEAVSATRTERESGRERTRARGSDEERGRKGEKPGRGIGSGCIYWVG